MESNVFPSWSKEEVSSPPALAKSQASQPQQQQPPSPSALLKLDYPLPSIHSVVHSTSLKLPPFLSNPQAAAVAPPPSARLNQNDSGVFYLIQQPRQHQRKAYEKENRFILPNPLVVAPRAHIPPQSILNGTVEVKLVEEDGTATPDSMLSGGGARPLDESKQAKFSLKVKANTGLKKFQLEFRILYHFQTPTQIRRMEQIIVSSPFEVHSNSNQKGVPRITAILPLQGGAGSEVWIRGEDFGSQCRVLVAEHEAIMGDWAPNLIVCYLPSLSSTDPDGFVNVVVENIQAKTPADGVKVHRSNIVSFRYENPDVWPMSE